jgi:hypothetical protein
VRYAKVVKAHKVQPASAVLISSMSVGGAAAPAAGAGEAAGVTAASAAAEGGVGAGAAAAAWAAATAGPAGAAEAPAAFTAFGTIGELGGLDLAQGAPFLDLHGRNDEWLLEEALPLGLEHLGTQLEPPQEQQLLLQGQGSAGSIGTPAAATTSASAAAAAGEGSQAVPVTLFLGAPLKQSLGSRPTLYLAGFGHKDLDKRVKAAGISANGSSITLKSQSQSLGAAALAELAARVNSGAIQPKVIGWWDAAPGPTGGSDPVLLHFQLEVVVVAAGAAVGAAAGGKEESRPATGEEELQLRAWLQQRLGG